MKLSTTGYGGVILFVLTIFFYAPGCWNDFVTWDDYSYVVENPHVLDGLSLENIRWSWSTLSQANYHPLTWMSLQLDATLFGTEPFGFHLSSVLLHAVNVLLIYSVMSRLTRSPSIGWCVAAIWGLHPVHVESVAWISERKDVLSILFGLLAFRRYLKIRIQEDPSTINSLATDPVLHFWFVCSLLSKQTLVTLPIMMILADYLMLSDFPNPNQKDQQEVTSHQLKAIGNSVYRHIPLLVMSLIFSVVVFFAQQQGATVADLESHSLGQRLLNGILSYGRYLIMLLSPVGQYYFFYPMEPLTWLDWKVILSFFFLVAMTLTGVVFKHRHPWLLFGWLWFLISLLPMIGIIQIGSQALSDRYLYWPAIGIDLIVIKLIDLIIQHTIAKQNDHRDNYLIAVCLILMAGLSIKTVTQIQTWRDDPSLFGHALNFDPDNSVANNNYGYWLLRNRQFSAALPFFEIGINANSKNALAWRNRAICLWELGDRNEAINSLMHAIELRRKTLTWRSTLGSFLYQTQRYSEAEQYLQESLNDVPDDPAAWYHLGRCNESLGKWGEAKRCYQILLQLNPGDAQATLRLNAIPSQER